MIESFANKLSEDLFYDRHSKEARRFPSELIRKARMKLLYLNEAEDLSDLRVPPANHLELLSGGLSGFYSVRINNQWRLIFKWQFNNAYEVKIEDYH